MDPNCYTIECGQHVCSPAAEPPHTVHATLRAAVREWLHILDAADCPGPHTLVTLAPSGERVEEWPLPPVEWTREQP